MWQNKGETEQHQKGSRQGHGAGYFGIMVSVSQPHHQGNHVVSSHLMIVLLKSRVIGVWYLARLQRGEEPDGGVLLPGRGH